MGRTWLEAWFRVCVLILVRAAITGCPQTEPEPEPEAQPQLSVSTNSIALSGIDDTATFGIWNSGDPGSTLEFSVASPPRLGRSRPRVRNQRRAR